MAYLSYGYIALNRCVNDLRLIPSIAKKHVTYKLSLLLIAG